MKKFKIQFLAISISILFLSSCGIFKTFYPSPELKAEKANHKTLAIVPFDVKLVGKKFLKMVPQDTLLEMQKNEGYLIQQTINNQLIGHKDDYTVSIQDINETNRTLEKAGINYENLFTKDISEILEKLNVDAIIIGTSERLLKSWAAHIFKGIAVSEPAPYVKYSAKLFSKKSKDQLWEYKENWQIGLADHDDQPHLYSLIAKKIRKNFPYKK